MKSLSTIPFILLATLTAWGQNKGEYDKLVAEGNRYFDHSQYHLAIEYFSHAVTFDINNPAVDYKLAEAYRHTFNYTEAEAYYLKVFYTAQSDFPLSLYYYALMLKLNGNLSEAMERFDQFVALYDRNSMMADYAEQAIIEKAGCEMAHEQFGMPLPHNAVLLPSTVNTPFNDFAPAPRDSGTLVVTSSRIPSNRKLIDQRNGEAFTDNFYFVKRGSAWEDRTRSTFWITNSIYHDGSGSFTRRGDQYFFTVCEERCRIFESHLEGSKWTRPVPLNSLVNLPETESKQPSISPGGDTLYFVSNRPGGFGKFDIWISYDEGDNAWSEPVNAGPTINTKANDITPSITDVPSVLFFSSEGHPGYGGFDLFVAKGLSNGDTVVYNLNLPFNSVKDDCFVAFHGQQMFWSSNRDGGLGGFDVYAANNISAIGLVSRLSLRNQNHSRTVTLTSRTARSENIALLASRNEETIDYNNLTYERKSVVNRMVENRLNEVAIRREDYADLTDEEFDVLKEISHSRFQTLLLKQKYASTLLTEVVKPAQTDGGLSVTGRVINSQNGLALQNARVLLTNEYGDILKITTTNEEGRFRFTDVANQGKLFLRLENAAASGASADGKKRHTASINAFVKDILIFGSDKPNTLYVENVYFDFDHYVIRPEAAQVLTELATYLKSNPGAQVEIFAFADDRGSSAYNFELTQKRGEAVVAFLTRHGVDETSLAIIPKGKQPVRAASNEIQRQYNRRAEFYINGVKEDFTPSVKTYILKKEADWDLIAKLTGISAEELQSLNGSQSSVVKPYQPIRVPMHASRISEELFFVGI